MKSILYFQKQDSLISWCIDSCVVVKQWSRRAQSKCYSFQKATLTLLGCFFGKCMKLFYSILFMVDIAILDLLDIFFLLSVRLNTFR